MVRKLELQDDLPGTSIEVSVRGPGMLRPAFVQEPVQRLLTLTSSWQALPYCPPVIALPSPSVRCKLYSLTTACAL